MDTYGSPEGYLFNLHTCSPTEAKRMWKASIKNQSAFVRFISKWGPLIVLILCLSGCGACYYRHI